MLTLPLIMLSLKRSYDANSLGVNQGGGGNVSRAIRNLGGDSLTIYSSGGLTGRIVVVISIGAAGALMVSKEVTEHFRSPTVPIKSKVGAGDSMVAGIVLGLAQGKSLRDAVMLGVAAGAAAVMTPGTELCRRVDTERLYKQMIKCRA